MDNAKGFDDDLVDNANAAVGICRPILNTASAAVSALTFSTAANTASTMSIW